MPGLCGCTVSLLERGVSSAEVVSRMAASLVYRSWHTAGTTFTDDRIAATFVTLAPFEYVTEYHAGGKAVVWVDGEYYPDNPAAAASRGSFAKLLHDAYAEGSLSSRLRSIDAVFAAVAV